MRLPTRATLDMSWSAIRPEHVRVTTIGAAVNQVVFQLVSWSLLAQDIGCLVFFFFCFFLFFVQKSLIFFVFLHENTWLFIRSASINEYQQYIMTNAQKGPYVMCGQRRPRSACA